MADKKEWMKETCETCIFRNGGDRCYHGPPNEKGDDYCIAAYYPQIVDIERGRGSKREVRTYIEACSRWESNG